VLVVKNNILFLFFNSRPSINMKTLVFLFALVAMATCDCGVLQRLKVKQQWSGAFGTAHRRGDFGTAIWRGWVLSYSVSTVGIHAVIYS
jgi:hypothetical protein